MVFMRWQSQRTDRSGVRSILDSEFTTRVHPVQTIFKHSHNEYNSNVGRAFLDQAYLVSNCPLTNVVVRNAPQRGQLNAFECVAFLGRRGVRSGREKNSENL
jgi:hypothetical protein